VYIRALLASFLAVGVVLLTAFAQEDALRVCPEGCPFASVQEAIERAEAGAVIRVLPGTYRESLLIDKDLALEGEGADGVELRVPASDEAVVTVRTPSASAGAPPIEVTLSGLTFAGGQTGVVVEQASVALRDNRFVDNRNGVDAFGFNHDSWEAEVALHFERNRIEGTQRRGDGVALLGNWRAVLRDNTISQKTTAVSVGGRVQAELDGNEILDSLNGVVVGAEARARLAANRVEGNVIGVHLGERAEAELVENELVDNLHYGVALTLEPCFGSVPSRFAGTLGGRDNRASGNWHGDFCPLDYPLPEGFFR